QELLNRFGLAHGQIKADLVFKNNWWVLGTVDDTWVVVGYGELNIQNLHNIADRLEDGEHMVLLHEMTDVCQPATWRPSVLSGSVTPDGGWVRHRTRDEEVADLIAAMPKLAALLSEPTVFDS